MSRSSTRASAIARASALTVMVARSPSDASAIPIGTPGGGGTKPHASTRAPSIVSAAPGGPRTFDRATVAPPAAARSAAGSHALGSAAHASRPR